jgi:hypothetical protein
MNRWDIQKKIVEKSIKDPNFKKKLMSHPKEALKSIFTKEEINYDLLDKLEIKVELEKQREWIISIPDVKIDKLTKNQLKGISGGIGVSASCSCVDSSCSVCCMTPCVGI